MPEFGVVLEIDVFQRSAKMLALLHGLPDPVREMEVFQPMNIGGDRDSVHRIESAHQSDLPASLRASAPLAAALSPKGSPPKQPLPIPPPFPSHQPPLPTASAPA